jgi:hypothetical protein
VFGGRFGREPRIIIGRPLCSPVAAASIAGVAMRPSRFAAVDPGLAPFPVAAVVSKVVPVAGIATVLATGIVAGLVAVFRAAAVATFAWGDPVVAATASPTAAATAAAPPSTPALAVVIASRVARSIRRCLEG